MDSLGTRWHFQCIALPLRLWCRYRDVSALWHQMFYGNVGGNVDEKSVFHTYFSLSLPDQAKRGGEEWRTAACMTASEN